jgi:hypothetical protein
VTIAGERYLAQSQNERDFTALSEAVASGRVVAESGL